MKIILSFLFICLFSGYSQNDYPEPAPTRLFYIQHSDNNIILTSMMQI
jgi:hypothetical protein